MGDMFKKYMNILAMCGAKLKEKNEVMFGRVKERISSVRAREKGKHGVEILMRNKLWKCLKECM